MPYRDKADRNAHMRARRRGLPRYVPPTLEERFWAKVDKNGPIPAHRPDLGPCWIWTGDRPGGIYGRIRGVASVAIGAHRQSLQWKIGRALEAGEFACHHCDTPRCVRPEHLFVGDRLSNAADMTAKGRGRFGPRSRDVCACGVALTDANRCGRRWQCRPCANTQTRAYRARTNSPERRARANALRRASREAVRVH